MMRSSALVIMLLALTTGSAEIDTWTGLIAATKAAAGKKVTATLSPSFTMAGYIPGTYGGGITFADPGTVFSIEGQGATFDAARAGSFFSIYSNSGKATLIVRNITMKNGYASIYGGGGAISVDTGGSIAFYGCTFVNNLSAGDGGGGAISVGGSGSVELDGCTFVTNTSPSYPGGALFVGGSDSGNNGICLIKGCSFENPSANNNDIARYDPSHTTNITFACADGNIGAPVQMQGNEISVIPPKELQCHPPH
jgi:hypothetical protein